MSIGGAVDAVVPLTATIWDGADHVVVPGTMGASPGAHTALPGTEAVRRAVALAVADRSPGCVTGPTVLSAVAASDAIVAGLDVATVLAGVTGGLAALHPSG